MSGHSYRIIELVGSSKISIDAAIRQAVEDAAETVRHIGWFQVVESRGHVETARCPTSR